MSTAEVPLTNGKVALVDEEDFDTVSRYKWRADEQRPGLFYAVTGHNTMMHKLICPDYSLVDHKDGNSLNNTRVNLRSADKATNGMNRGAQVNNRSGFKGVSFYPKNQNWRAAIHRDGKQVHLGYFPTAEDAARAYDKAALVLHGAFAFFNFRDIQEGIFA